MNEFELIAKFFKPLTNNDPAALNLLDDAALLVPQQKLVITTDTIAENVHFIASTKPSDLAKKLMRVNLSDLAAKGACPKYYLLAITIPTDTSDEWLYDFAAGLAVDSKEFAISLIGGDTVRHNGPLVLSLTAIGELSKSEQLISRANARVGDDIYVTGTIGDAALGLLALQNKITTDDDQRAYLASRYHIPIPRLAIGRQLHGIANSAIDISDGLAADAEHIAQNSGVQLVINAAKVPLSKAAQELVTNQPTLLESVLTGGDDYELLFTAPSFMSKKIAALAGDISKIGHVVSGSGVAILDKNGESIQLKRKGYLHS